MYLSLIIYVIFVSAVVRENKGIEDSEFTFPTIWSYKMN